MECRVYNEDPQKYYCLWQHILHSHFLPGDGVVTFKNQVKEDDKIMIENNITVLKNGQNNVSFDPMLLKVITSGNSRQEVIDRMKKALRQCHIFGVPTNIQFLMNALNMKRFCEEGADSQTIVEEKEKLLGTNECSSFELGNVIASYLFHTKCNHSSTFLFLFLILLLFLFLPNLREFQIVFVIL